MDYFQNRHSILSNIRSRIQSINWAFPPKYGNFHFYTTDGAVKSEMTTLEDPARFSYFLQICFKLKNDIMTKIQIGPGVVPACDDSSGSFALMTMEQSWKCTDEVIYKKKWNMMLGIMIFEKVYLKFCFWSFTLWSVVQISRWRIVPDSNP